MPHLTLFVFMLQKCAKWRLHTELWKKKYDEVMSPRVGLLYACVCFFLFVSVVIWVFSFFSVETHKPEWNEIKIEHTHTHVNSLIAFTGALYMVRCRFCLNGSMSLSLSSFLRDARLYRKNEIWFAISTWQRNSIRFAAMAMNHSGVHVHLRAIPRKYGPNGIQ